MNKSIEAPGSGHLRRFLLTLIKLDIYSFADGKFSRITEFCERYSKKAVVLVGSNPSGKSPDNSAFHPDTKSRKFVDKWFDRSWCVAYENLVDFKTENNKQLSKTQIKENLWDIQSKMDAYTVAGYRIVACGKIAAMGLTMAEVKHFEMPHPSGLCRFWNDVEAGETKVEEMRCGFKLS